MGVIFGPVPSRRLGRSLGIDVVPAKTCSYDCVYCESGRTTHLSIQRTAFIPPEQVLKELEQHLSGHRLIPDVLTFSSAGEPTLYEPLGELIRAIKQRYRELPLVVLTNGSLLSDPQVRRDLLPADCVIPSVDAVSPEVFRRINRPHPLLELPVIMEGLSAFRREYRGRLHMEVMLVAGFNDHSGELAQIGRFVEQLGPDRVELNTVVRPPASPGIVGLEQPEMERAAAGLPEDLTTIIGHFAASRATDEDASLAARVAQMVRRRPCTAAEMALSLGAAPEDLDRVLQELEGGHEVVRCLFGDQEYYRSP